MGKNESPNASDLATGFLVLLISTALVIWISGSCMTLFGLPLVITVVIWGASAMHGTPHRRRRRR